MKLFIQVGCVIGLVAPVAGIDSAFAQCIATAKPDYMTGSPPKGPRTPRGNRCQQDRQHSL